MRQYIGTKVINAVEMTRQEYNDFRGWELPKDENPNDAGYLVEYLDGGQANTVQYDGYVTWSPKEVFSKAYRPVDRLSFGMAIEALKVGHIVARAGWNGNGMYVKLVKARDFEFSELCAHFVIKNTRNSFDTWVASVSDTLADDWYVIE
jgi:hypothetical protein